MNATEAADEDYGAEVLGNTAVVVACAVDAAVDAVAEWRWQLAHLIELLGFTLTTSEVEIAAGLCGNWEGSFEDLIAASQAVMA